jgi:uncharacterized phage protein (TIGR01671 family)
MKDHHRMRAWSESLGRYLEDFVIFQNGHIHEFGGYIEDAKLEQCTGEKSKYEKLIYQGDVVRAHLFHFDGYGESEREIVGKVVWDDNAEAQWVILTEDSYYSFSETSHFEEPCIEIIGTIHD